MHEIPIRLQFENQLADLRTIEELIERRKKIKISSASSQSVSYNSKDVTSDDDIYFTIVFAPIFAIEPVLTFNRENID